MPTGKIKYWNDDRGFGFIIRDGDRAEIFAHHSNLDESLDGLPVGGRVSFEVVESTRKPGQSEARNVQIITEGNK